MYVSLLVLSTDSAPGLCVSALCLHVYTFCACNGDLMRMLTNTNICFVVVIIIIVSMGWLMEAVATAAAMAAVVNKTFDVADEDDHKNQKILTEIQYFSLLFRNYFVFLEHREKYVPRTFHFFSSSFFAHIFFYLKR